MKPCSFESRVIINRYRGKLKVSKDPPGLKNFTLIRGIAGTGKTEYCLMRAREFIKKGKTVLYLSTDSPPLWRIKDLVSNPLFKIIGSIITEEQIVDAIFKHNVIVDVIIIDDPMDLQYHQNGTWARPSGLLESLSELSSEKILALSVR